MDVVGLANDGRGLSWREMVRTIVSCLKGSRAKAAKVEIKSCRARSIDDQREVWDKIRLRLMEFQEGLLERQQRLDKEWQTLSRGKKSALEFAPLFESQVAEMELAGVGKSDRDLLLRYLATVAPAHLSLIHI